MELIRLKGRGDYATHEACYGDCECTFEPEYHCKDCFGTELYCKDCMVERHHDNLLHRIKAFGERCFNQSRAFDNDFVILDINHVHEVMLHTTQLLQACLYPATSSNPKSAATFRVLQHFQMLTFESKQTLTCLTDNMSIKPCKDRYKSLLHMIKQWWNITLLKCFSQGHNPAGINVTEPGGRAALCHTCPHPCKNLPDDWRMAPPDKQWLYTQYVAIDANFRVDPGLSKGWSYFVEETGFKLFLKDIGKVSQEVHEHIYFKLLSLTCVNHNTMNLTETKNSRGLAATGAGTVDCSHHNFKRPCRWSKHLWDCMSKYPSHLHFEREGKTLTFLIPKFHLPAHIATCQISFSHNLIKGMGHTDCEAPEQGWANINPVTTSTWEMGPGACRDTLDDHFSYYNWKKVTNFGISLLSKIKTAISECEQHQCDFDEFNHALTEEWSSEVAQWKEVVESWESNHSSKNLFEIRMVSMMLAAVHLKLSQQEAEDLENGLNNSLHMDISPGVLISSGLDLEEQQIEQWYNIQLLYMPAVGRLHAVENAKVQSLCEEKAHEVKLWFPSKVKETTEPCEESLCTYEWEVSMVLNKVEQTIKTAVVWYRRAWSAVKMLSVFLGKPNWEVKLPELQLADVCGMIEGEARQSEGTHTLSWIWKTHGAWGIDLILRIGLHIEWCKSWACTNWWAEEVELLQEKMWCVASFLSWHAGWWEEQANQRTALAAPEQERIKGYVKQQATLHRAMQDRFQKMWSVVPALLQSTLPALSLSVS
ncbi:hypothetical protein BDR05DRAFT_974119 [Suillus weaverae]|nr:hypothetical protein BDR05DRAFT_974119 [Suillus weaverae]